MASADDAAARFLALRREASLKEAARNHRPGRDGGFPRASARGLIEGSRAPSASIGTRGFLALRREASLKDLVGFVVRRLR